MNNEQKPTILKFVIGFIIGALLFMLVGIIGVSAPLILSGMVLLVAIWGAAYLYSGQVVNRSDKAEEKRGKWEEAFEQDSELND